MNVASLEAVLPAFTVASITDVTAAGQVHVADEPRSVQKGTPDVWWQFLGETPEPDEEGGLGKPTSALRFRATITSQGATPTARRTWLRELRTALDGRAPATLAAVTGFDYARVVAGQPEPASNGFVLSGSTGAAAVILEVDFVGDVHPDDAGA